MGEFHVGVYQQSYSAAGLAKFGVEALCRAHDVHVSYVQKVPQKSELEPGNTSRTALPTQAADNRAGTGDAGGGDNGPGRRPPNTVCDTSACACRNQNFLSSPTLRPVVLPARASPNVSSNPSSRVFLHSPHAPQVALPADTPVPLSNAGSGDDWFNNGSEPVLKLGTDTGGGDQAPGQPASEAVWRSVLGARANPSVVATAQFARPCTAAPGGITHGWLRACT